MTNKDEIRSKTQEWYSRTAGEFTAVVYADMMERPDWVPHFWNIPERMHAGICRWVLFGVRPGDFLCAVLRHDLMGAARMADDENQQLLYKYCLVLVNATPAACHGPDSLKTWRGVWPAQDLHEDSTA
jgi:hypothetical protein